MKKKKEERTKRMAEKFQGLTSLKITEHAKKKTYVRDINRLAHRSKLTYIYILSLMQASFIQNEFRIEDPLYKKKLEKEEEEEVAI